MIIRLPGCYPLHFCASAAHWAPNGTNHGKISNPRLFAAQLVDCRAYPRTPDSSTARRLWLYFKGGYACHVEFYIDRRPLPAV